MASDPMAAERDRIVDALKRCDFVMNRTAAELGIASSTLTRWVAKHELRDLIAEHNPESAGRRFPRAPHEASRQAAHQKRNREKGLCGCGALPGRKPGGGAYRQCDRCRSRSSERKGGTARPSGGIPTKRDLDLAREVRDALEQPSARETVESVRRRARGAW